MMNATLVASLAAHSIPSRLPVSTDERRETRNWVIRLSAVVGDGWNPDGVAVSLTKKSASAFHAAREARGLPLDDDDPFVPIVRLLPIDDQYLVMSVLTIRLEEDDVHSYLVAASAALRALDEVMRIDDIQGIPRRFWGVLLGL